MKRFWDGFLFVFNGFRRRKSIPGISKFIWIPHFISFVIFVSLFSAGTKYLFGLFSHLTEQYLNFGGEIVTSILLIVFFMFALISGFVLSGYLVYSISSVVASPFYSVLAEKTLSHRGVILPPKRDFSDLVRLSVRMLWVAARRAVLLLGIFALLAVLALIPGLNLASTLGAFVILAFDMADYSFEARQMGLRERFNDLRGHIWEYFGMGTALALTAVVPGLILLTMPYAVIGAAELQSQRQVRIPGGHDSGLNTQ